jgi:CheY-like chemotaxis protein
MLIILDLHLPSLPGTDLLTHIRQAEHLSESKVILATADYRLAKTIESDADLVLVKPIRYKQLLSLCERIAQAY